jgi:hypothetical protein
MHLPYPKSFPNPTEEEFLRLVFSSDTDFPQLWNSWKEHHDFNDTDTAQVHLFPLVYLKMKKLHMTSDDLFKRVQGIYKHAWVRKPTTSRRY